MSPQADPRVYEPASYWEQRTGRNRREQTQDWDETHRHAWSAKGFDALLESVNLRVVRRRTLSNPWPVVARLGPAVAAAMQRVTFAGRYGDLYSVVAQCDS